MADFQRSLSDSDEEDDDDVDDDKPPIQKMPMSHTPSPNKRKRAEQAQDVNEDESPMKKIRVSSVMEHDSDNYVVDEPLIWKLPMSHTSSSNKRKRPEQSQDVDEDESPMKKTRPSPQVNHSKQSMQASDSGDEDDDDLDDDVDDDELPNQKQPMSHTSSNKRKRDVDEDEPPNQPNQKQQMSYTPSPDKRKRDVDEDKPPNQTNQKQQISHTPSPNKRKRDVDEDEPPKKKPATAAERMMAKMGYKAGTGLGKHAQGRVNIVEASLQRGRRGLGMSVPGLEPSMTVEWSEEQDQVIIDEVVDWLPHCKNPVPDIATLRSWKIIGPKKLTLDNETNFCTEETLNGVLSCKSIFDLLEPEEMRKARTRSNPYETIRGAIFLNRAAMKMANMDAVLDFMFTNPKYPNGKPMVGHNELLYFADVCAGPGGFSEYVLWRTKGESKGFGLTLRGSNDFKLEDFFAGPPEMFEPHYGVGGNEGDGDIFRPDNQKAFVDFVLQNTDGLGVHMVMADGGFSVEGQENIQEILSKQLYLCQFLVAISILREGGHFVCKLFDLFTPFSVGLVYLMYRIFDRVSIYKPVTSRPANSERYIVCKSLRKDKDPVKQYFDEINRDLNVLLGSTSKEDITDIVPMSFLQNDEPFYEYMCVSNDSLGKLQILNLKKIKAFTQNTNLYETRQNEVRTQLLKKWQVDDELRTAPKKCRPLEKFHELVQNEDSYFDHITEQLTAESLRSIKTVYDYRCIVTGDLPEKRVYILSTGRTWVFQRACHSGAKWMKLQDSLKIELPRDTLFEAEFVTEYRGEGTGQRKVSTLHALDALFLYGKDVRNLHFNERIQKLRRFVKSVTKLTRSDLVRVVVPEVFRFEEIGQIFERLDLKKVKGGGQGERLCYTPKDSVDNRFFRPTGLYIIKTVREPWTMCLSKSTGKKYFFNTSTRESKFECPQESIANVQFTKLHSYHWAWEEGVKLIPQQQFQEDDSKLSKTNVMDYLQRLKTR